jgi:hypothetical protein
MKNKIKKQVVFVSDAEVILTYNSHDNKHGICGHFFEVIDYYILLKDYYKVEIILSEDIKEEDIKIALSKYKPNLVKDLKINFVRPRIYNCPNSILIFTDGLLNAVNIYNVKRLILFPCGTRDYSKLPLYNTLINKILFMGDKRLNYKLPVEVKKINYVKKLNFDALNPILKIDVFNYMERPLPNEVILYATSNCKLINNCTIKKHLSNLDHSERLLIIINEGSPLLDDPIIDKQVGYKVVPVPNIFEIMATYIYTPIDRKWDCSPRMIAECKYFGIPVIYDDGINEDYLEVDTGLMVRKWDIENNFDSLYLDGSDIIIETIKRILEEK